MDDSDKKKDQSTNDTRETGQSNASGVNEKGASSTPLETDTPLGDPGQIYETSSARAPSAVPDEDPWMSSSGVVREPDDKSASASPASQVKSQFESEKPSRETPQQASPQQSSPQQSSPQSEQQPGVMNTKKDKLDLSEENWDRDLVNRLAFASLNEQRRSRRWSVFFKVLAFTYVGVILFYIPTDFNKKGITGGKHTAIIDVSGAIAADADANADSIVGGLRAAFENKNTAAVILRINSPGGSPVQAGYVYDEIKRLRAKYQAIKLYAVITDMCASGGYYIAAAADEIYADKASIVGSIGVLMNGFGFVDAMQKMGIERRLLTAGEHKGVMDPFSPLKKSDTEHMQVLLNGVHQQFINVVKEGRGDRLKDDPKLFSGLFWNGEEGVKLGLVDGLGSSSYVAREVVGVDKLVDFTSRSNYLDRFAERLGATFAKVMSTTLGLQTVRVE